MVFQRDALVFKQAGPIIFGGNDGGLVKGRIGPLMRHLEEKQKSKLFQVVAVGQSGVTQDVAIVPEFLDDHSRSVGHRCLRERDFLIGLALAMGANFDTHFPVKPPEKIEQLVCGEAAEMSVHQMRYVGLCDAQNAGNFTLLQLLFFQNFEDMKPHLGTGQELIGILQSQVGENVPRANFKLS